MLVCARNKPLGQVQILKFKESTGIKPDAAVVLYHLHSRSDGRPFSGVEGGVNRVVEDAIWPVIAGGVVVNKIMS